MRFLRVWCQRSIFPWVIGCRNRSPEPPLLISSCHHRATWGEQWRPTRPIRTPPAPRHRNFSFKVLRRPFEPRQFTSDDFTNTLKRHAITISRDGKGRYMDNIFVERLWRSLKYEEVYLNAYASVAEAKVGIGSWLGFYNEERQHQSLGYRTPRQAYEAE